jgi:hypothetical protein
MDSARLARRPRREWRDPGTWRRENAAMAVHPWRRISGAEREAVEAEANSLPMPGIEGKISISWGD